MIEGEWTIIAVEYAGEAMPGRTGRLEIFEKRFSLQIGGTPREVGAVEYAAEAEPARVDLVWREAGGETRRIAAIVRVKGQLMQLCYFPEAGGGRPATFESRAVGAAPPAILVRCRRRE